MIELFSLVDITKTNITRNNRPQGSNLSQLEWDFLRNQQRNWDTVIQLLGLRFQPMNITPPQCLLNQKSDYFGFGNIFANYSNLSVWKCSCTFDHEINIDSIVTDFNNVPIITGLNETVKFNSSCFSTATTNCNITIKSKR